MNGTKCHKYGLNRCRSIFLLLQYFNSSYLKSNETMNLKLFAFILLSENFILLTKSAANYQYKYQKYGKTDISSNIKQSNRIENMIVKTQNLCIARCNQNAFCLLAVYTHLIDAQTSNCELYRNITSLSQIGISSVLKTSLLKKGRLMIDEYLYIDFFFKIFFLFWC